MQGNLLHWLLLSIADAGIARALGKGSQGGGMLLAELSREWQQRSLSPPLMSAAFDRVSQVARLLSG